MPGDVYWKLEPTNDPPAVISRFKPSQLRLPIRRFGSCSVEQLPEAQYQDEFYRSVFSIAFGNVRFSPEFVSARGAKVAGQIDFFIPVMKWGIEMGACWMRTVHVLQILEHTMHG